jgi:signal transduction histidine kinase
VTSDAPPTQVCPRCRGAVTPRDAVCPHCGVDLALAAVLAERQALATIPTESTTPFVADVMLPRFGEYLTRTGYITEAQLAAALRRQHELLPGERQTLGQILLEMRVVTRQQLDQASMEQVQELQSALRQMNDQLEQRVQERTRELQAATQKLAELDKLKGNFIANISHELRTPLTKIKGFHSLLEGRALGPLSGEQEEAIQVMGRGIAELERLVADLIQFASGARGEMILRRAPCSAAELTAAVLSISEEKASKSGVRLNADIAARLPRVVADAERIRWVLTQLVDNAIKFTPSGGTVTMRAVAADGRVRFAVEDTGAGIPAERISELFEPFHQLDGSTTRKRGGTGLGLALVKRIIEAHNSTVQVQSEVERGSLFWFELPVEGA